MKSLKLLLCISLTCGCITLNAQNFSLSPGKVHTQTLNINDQSYDGITFTNITNIKLTLNWTLLSIDTLADSHFSMCASGFCWIGMPPTGSFPSLNPGQQGWLKLHAYSGNITGTNKIVYLVDDGNSQYDTLTFFINVANLTGIQKEMNNDPFRIVSATGSADLKVLVNEKPAPGTRLLITGLTGATLLQQDAMQGENLVSLGQLSKGIYFVTYQGASGSYTQKFVL